MRLTIALFFKSAVGGVERALARRVADFSALYMILSTRAKRKGRF